VRGTHHGGLQPVGGSGAKRTVARLDKIGVAQDVEHRHWADGAQEVSCAVRR
jgi:hypothetical protein